MGKTTLFNLTNFLLSMRLFFFKQYQIVLYFEKNKILFRNDMLASS